MPPLSQWWVVAAAIIIGAAILAFAISRNQEVKPESASLPQIASAVEEGEVKTLTVQGNLLVATKTNGAQITAYKEPSLSAFETLKMLGVPEKQLQDLPIVVQQPGGGFSFSSLLPWLLLGFMGYVIFRGWQQQKASSTTNFNGIGRSNPRVLSGNTDKRAKMEHPQVTFRDVAGQENATYELQEVVEFLRDPTKFTKLGARVPKGVLMAGPPGTGKTLLAKAVAGEAGVPFFSISGSEFVEMFVGVGASRVRDLFKRAREQSPAIIFVDEIDAVGRHRGVSLGNGNDEREQTLNQILVEMDGFDTDTNVIVIAATNRPDILDPALLRPGRFDRKVILDRPDVEGREAILKVHTRGKPLATNISTNDLARLTPGFVGADLENLVNEAAILAARRNKTEIGRPEFQDAMERIIAGPERQGKILGDYERQVIAYHEAGHAVVMHYLEFCDPVHKVSIVSRGMALGYTMPLPEGDKYLRTRETFEDEIVGLLGGRASEELIFNRITTGAANDLERATKLARAMVTRFGFSQKLGLRSFVSQEQGNPYLGLHGESRDYSEEVAQAIDREIHAILETAYQRAKKLLTEYRSKLDLLAEGLLEHETVERPEFEEMMA
jgi:cell division protease FtsH